MKFWIGIFSAIAACSCGAGQKGVPTQVDITNYYIDQKACVDMADAQVTADQCRALDKSVFCSKFPDMQQCKDGGQ
jgi:hypothetical protein